MQVLSPSSPASKFARKERFSEAFGNFTDDFGSKLKICSKDKEDDNLEKSWWNQKDESYTNEDEEEDFSFVSLNAENSPITAEEAFEDGQIRPVYPLFDRNLLFEYERDEDDSNKKALRSPLKKLFIEAATEEDEEEEEEEEETEPIGPFCSWKNRTVQETASASSPETCRKSNSTGFSKLWRFRDLVSRSSSDGKDTFVFLSNNGNTDKKQSSLLPSRLSRVKSKLGKDKTRTEKNQKKMRTKSAHEKLYMRNKAIREEGKRRSYLPYKHVGFFTNLNDLTRNIHPY